MANNYIGHHQIAEADRLFFFTTWLIVKKVDRKNQFILAESLFFQPIYL